MRQDLRKWPRNDDERPAGPIRPRGPTDEARDALDRPRRRPYVDKEPAHGDFFLIWRSLTGADSMPAGLMYFLRYTQTAAPDDEKSNGP